MAGVVDRQLVVVRAPEKRDVIEAVAVTEHVASDDLTLTFRHHPVLDAQANIRISVRPARDISGGENTVDAGFEELVDREPIVQFQPSGFG